MKKALSLFLGFVLLFSLVACNSGDITPTDTSVTNTEVVEESSSKQDDKVASNKETSTSSIAKGETSSKTQGENEKIISYKDSKTLNSENEVVGKVLNYTIGVDSEISINTEKTYSPIIATTYSQLEKGYNNAVDGCYNNQSFIEKYNESFFKDKAVILLFDQYGIGLNSNLRTIKSITIQGDTLYLNRSYNNIYTDVGNDHFIDVLTDFITCVEIDKTDLENVKYLSLATWETDK